MLTEKEYITHIAGDNERGHFIVLIGDEYEYSIHVPSSSAKNLDDTSYNFGLIYDFGSNAIKIKNYTVLSEEEYFQISTYFELEDKYDISFDLICKIQTLLKQLMQELLSGNRQNIPAFVEL